MRRCGLHSVGLDYEQLAAACKRCNKRLGPNTLLDLLSNLQLLNGNLGPFYCLYFFVFEY
jgi:hypothetical protein